MRTVVRPLTRRKTNISRPTTRLFRVDLIPEPDGSWTVDVPDLPGCVTWGHTREQALTFAHEAIVAYLDALKKLGEPIPMGASSHEAVTVAIAL